MATEAKTGLYYTVTGDGPNLILGFPYLASFPQVMPSSVPDVAQQLSDALATNHRVLRLDYPSIGLSRDIPENALSADRVASDLLSVADDAGFDRFTYVAYSWGAAAGLQLAARTTRIDRLVIGGWPPLGAEYDKCLRAARAQLSNPPPEVQVVLRSPEQYEQWIHFYESIGTFSEEALLEKLQKDGVACLAFVAENGDVGAGEEQLHNATIIKKQEDALKGFGWEVAYIEDAGHEIGLDAAAVLSVMRPFLERTGRGLAP
ncbi:MAG: hypothetical protein Cons2KO_10230 [Congregibacter sp.]